MAVLYYEGFELGVNDAGSLADHGWTFTGASITTTCRTGSRALEVSSSAGTKGVLYRPGDAAATWIFGFATNAGHAGAWKTFCKVGEGNFGIAHYVLDLHANGAIRAVKAADSSVYGTSAAGVVPGAGDAATGTWKYIEVKSTIDDTAGAIQIKVNGTTVLNLTGLDTNNAGTNIHEFVSWNGFTPNFEIDDIYLADTTGSAPGNDFLGDVIVTEIVPDGNGNYSNLTGSDADQTDNYLQVDEWPALTSNESDYNGSATSGDEDTYTLTATGLASGTTIYAAALVHLSAATSTPKAARPLWRISSTDYVGSDVNLTTSYVQYEQIYETSPATSSAWTAAELDGAEAGFEART